MPSSTARGEIDVQEKGQPGGSDGIFVFCGTTLAAQDERFAPPDRTWQQGSIYENSAPTRFETLLRADPEERHEVSRKVLEIFRMCEDCPTVDTLSHPISDQYIQHSGSRSTGHAPADAVLGLAADQYSGHIDDQRVIVQDSHASALVNVPCLRTHFDAEMTAVTDSITPAASANHARDRQIRGAHV